MSDRFFGAIVLLFVATLMAIFVSTLPRQEQYQVTVSPELGKMVSVTDGRLKSRFMEETQVYVLQFQHGFAMYVNDIADSCLVQEFKGEERFETPGCFHLNAAVKVQKDDKSDWIPIQLWFHHLDDDEAKAVEINKEIEGWLYAIMHFKKTDVLAENIAGVVTFSM